MIFIDEKSIGTAIFEEEKSISAEFEDRKSDYLVSREIFESMLDEKLSKIEPVIKNETKIIKESLDNDKFLDYFNKVILDIDNKVKESVLANTPEIKKEIIYQEKDINYEEILEKILPQIDIPEPIKLEEITFEKFLEFFKELPKEELEKIRGKTGRKGRDGGAGGTGAQGIQGETGPAGSATIALLEFQEASGVVGNTETQIFSFTNSTGSSIFIDELSGEGNARSEWVILFNDVEEDRSRSSVSDQNIEIPYFNHEVTNTSTVKVKVTHYESVTTEYSVTLKYHA